MQIQDLVLVNEVEDGIGFAGELFARRFGQPLVEFGRHYVAFHRGGDGRFSVLGYLHVTDCGDIGLVGGGCTDNLLLAAMPDDHRETIRLAGGVLLQLLRFVFDRSHDDYEAFFGVCGNPRAYEVDLQAGFRPTDIPNLLVYWPREPGEARRRALIAKAASFMPF